MSDYVQPSLIDMQPLVRAQGATIQERFESFHSQNGWVYRAFESLAEAWIAKGHRRIGMKMLGEVVRWQYGQTVGDHFKINNSYLSRYSRLLLEDHPEWAEHVETRTLRAA